MLNRLMQDPRVVLLDFVMQAPAERASDASESAELRWLREHREEVLRYAGQWLLLAHGELVAHSENFRDVRYVADREQLEAPFVYYVPTEAEANFVIL